MHKLISVLSLFFCLCFLSSTEKKDKSTYHMSTYFFEDIYGNIKKIRETYYDKIEDKEEILYDLAYAFDKKGVLIYEYTSYADEVLANDCFKQENNTLIEQPCREGLGIGDAKEIYTLDEKGRITKHTTEEENFKSVSQATYNEKNQITSYISIGSHKNANGKWDHDYSDTITYFCTSDGKVDRLIRGCGAMEHAEIKFERDEKGNLIKIDEAFCKGTLHEYYNHDSHGNWLQSTTTEEGSITYVKRVIEYWK